jgi:hypothetical protein
LIADDGTFQADALAHLPDQFGWIELQCPRNVNKLHRIESALAKLIAGYKLLMTAKGSGKLLLAKFLRLSSFDQPDD